MGQVSGEYRSQGAKVGGKHLMNPLGFSPSAIDSIDGAGFIVCFLFVLSGFLQHLYGDSFRASVVFMSMGGDLCIPRSFFLCFFLLICILLSETCFHFCLPLVSFRGARSRVVGFWLASFAFSCLVVDDPYCSMR